MVEMGYKHEDVLNSLQTRAYDEAFGTYLLLGTKPSEVGFVFETSFVTGTSFVVKLFLF